VFEFNTIFVRKQVGSGTKGDRRSKVFIRTCWEPSFGIFKRDYGTYPYGTKRGVFKPKPTRRNWECAGSNR